MSARYATGAIALLLLLTPLHAQEAPSGDGSTPLHWAAYRDDLAKVDQLVRSGASVDAANDIGATALWAASMSGSAPVVKRLLDAGANPDAALLSGETPLMAAARAGKTAAVEALLARGANPNARGARAQTALMWAVAQKHASVVKVLLAANADVHARTESWSQMMAVPPHGLPEYNRLIPQGSETALMFAARVGDAASAKLLVEAGASVDDHDACRPTPAPAGRRKSFHERLSVALHTRRRTVVHNPMGGRSYPGRSSNPRRCCQDPGRRSCR
jgi:ankyrin repeat protein